MRVWMRHSNGTRPPGLCSMLPSISKTRMSSAFTFDLSVPPPGLSSTRLVPGTRTETCPNIPIVPCKLSMRVKIAVLRRNVASLSKNAPTSPLNFQVPQRRRRVLSHISVRQHCWLSVRQHCWPLFHVNPITEAAFAAVGIDDLDQSGIPAEESGFAAIKDRGSVAPLLVAFETQVLLWKVGEAGILLEGGLAMLGLIENAHAREPVRRAVRIEIGQEADADLLLGRGNAGEF